MYECIEEKESDTSDTLRNDCTIDHRSFVPGDFKNPSVRIDHKYDSSCTTRDAQIQTSGRKSLQRRRRMKRRPKPAKKIEKISPRKRFDNESRIVADLRIARSRSPSGRRHRDEPLLRVRVLENKRTEYVNKFTAVTRQIEEITATLRETCCDDENSRNYVENRDEYFSLISDEAKVNTANWSDVESRSAVARRRKDGLVNVKRIIGKSKSDRCKNVQETLHVDNLNNETVLSIKKTVARSRRKSEKIPNNVFGHDSVRAIKETASNRTSRSKARTKCRFVKQMSPDLDLAEDQDDGLQECLIENESFDQVCLKTNFAVVKNDERVIDFAESLANLEELRYCKIIEEKMGEVSVLEDIKRRIDRDFDDPLAERSDKEDFFTVSQSSDLDHRNVFHVTSATTIEGFKSPLILTSLDPIETEVHNSVSISAMSEHSNKTSAMSKYFSCTRIPSLISLTKNEDKLAVEVENRSLIIHDSHSNLHSNHYDSHSNLGSNNCSFSNLDSNLDYSRPNLECTARCHSSAQYTSPNKSLIEAANGLFEISEGQESFAEDKIRERELSFLEESVRKEWRAEKRYTADSTLETSKSSRYVGSIDSGVFSSSLIDLCPAESSFNVGRTKFKKKRCIGRLDGLPAVVDSGSDSYTDDTLDRKVNDVVRDLTKNLILCERKSRMKLKVRDAHYIRIRLQKS